MPAPVTTENVWTAIKNQMFGVVGTVTARGASRTAGIVYVVHDRKLYFGTGRTAWKTRHLARNPQVSMTVTIAKRIPFMPWIKIPPATISFSGTARIMESQDAPASVCERLLAGLKDDSVMEQSVIAEMTPTGDFITYGVGVSLRTMLRPEDARGRTPVQ